MLKLSFNKRSSKKTVLKRTKLKPIITGTLAGTLLALSSTALLAQNSPNEFFDEATAEHSRKNNEAKSLIGGAIIGGIIAGPPGAIVVATIGALASNHNSSKKQKEQLQASLAQSQTELYALQEQQKNLEALYQLALEEKQNNGFINANVSTNNNGSGVTCCADTALALHFKSNSADIEAHYNEELKELARLATIVPDATIEITGYADRRGSSKTNFELSQNRVNAVKTTLLSMGVNKKIIQSNAFGENQPLDSVESLEGNFFDRRVRVKIRSSHNDFLTLSQ